MAQTERNTKSWGQYSAEFGALVIFGAVGQCMWDWIQINYSLCVHGNEGTCYPVQQCGSSVCVSWFLDQGGATWQQGIFISGFEFEKRKV